MTKDFRTRQGSVCKNDRVEQVITGEVSADEMGSFVKKQSNVSQVNQLWGIAGLSLADSSGLTLAARVGKHTDELIEELVSTKGKTAFSRNGVG